MIDILCCHDRRSNSYVFISILQSMSRNNTLFL
jgi:hypothetical protein